MAARKGTEGTPKKRARAKDWAPAFLKAFADTHLVGESAKVAKVHRRTVYKRRDADVTFAEAWAEVEERSTEVLEQIAVRRAAAGSDVLLIFLLKARRPDTYREQHKIEHTGPEGGPIAAEIVTVGAKEVADAAHEFLARLAGPDS